MIEQDLRFAVHSRASTVVRGALSRGRRRVRAALERLEDRFVPSGLELGAITPLATGLLPSAAVVQDAGAPTLTLAFAVDLSSGAGGLVENVFDTTARIVEDVAGGLGLEGNEASASIDAGSGGLGAGASLSSSGASLELSVFPPGPGADGSAPTLPTIPGIPGGTSSPADPPLPGGSPVPTSPPGNSPSTPPLTTPTAGMPNEPGVAAGLVVNAPPSIGPAVAGPGLGVPGPGVAQGVVLVPMTVSIALPVDDEHPAQGVAAATSDPSLREASPNRGQVVAQDRATAVQGDARQDDDTTTVAVSFASPEILAPEPAPVVSLTPAELYVRDLEALERAFGELSARLDRLGDELAEQLVQISTLELLVAAGLGCLAFEVLRRWERQRQRHERFGSGSLPGPFYRPRVPVA